MPVQHFNGPVVTTSGGTQWQSRVSVEWTDPGTGPNVQVWYTYKFILLQGSVSDSGNLISWTDPWGAGSANNKPLSISGSGEVVVGGTFTAWHGVKYGANADMSFSLSINNIGPGDTGPSVASGTVWLGPRVASLPDTPTTPTLSNVTADNIRVNGSTPGNNGSAIVEYQFQHATNSAFTTGVFSPLHNGPFLDHWGLSKATQYWFRFRARNGVGWSPWSAAVSGKTLATIPVISNYSTNAVARNSFTVSNFVVSDNGGEAPSNVRVEYNTSASSTGSSIVTRGSWGDVTISGRAADTLYYYRASVWNSAGWSAWGAWKTVRTLLDVPNNMPAPTISNITDTSARMNWGAGSANGTTFMHYEYQVAIDKNFDNVILAGTTTELFADLTFAEPGQTRYVRVRMIATPNSGGWSPGTLLQMTGIAPGSGLRMYTFVSGVRKQLDLYTFVNGQRKQLKTFTYLNGQWEKE